MLSFSYTLKIAWLSRWWAVITATAVTSWLQIVHTANLCQDIQLFLLLIISSYSSTLPKQVFQLQHAEF